MIASVADSFWWVNGAIWVIIPTEMFGLWLLDHKLKRRSRG